MLASRHDFSPMIAVKNIVNLTAAYTVSDCLLIAGLDLWYFHDLSLFSFLSIWLQQDSFFFHRHISMVSTVMIPGYSFYATCSILGCQLWNIRCMKARCRRCFLGALSCCPEFKGIKSFFRSLIFVCFPCCCYDCFIFFRISVHFYHPIQYTTSFPCFEVFYQWLV